MINIVTNTESNKCYDYFFDDCETFFKSRIHSNMFKDNDISAMLSIDNAVLLDKNTGAIRTDFGITDIEKLSTGCKVVLVYLHILRNIHDYKGSVLLNITECGANALDVLFDLVENHEVELNITFLLKHRNNLFKCKEHNYVVDGERKSKLF